MALAEIVAFVLAATADVATVNVAVVLPAGMVTLAGGAAAGSELLSVTVILPGAAGASSVTVPVELWPPIRVVGLSVSDIRATGRTVSEAFTDVPFSVAVMLPVVDAVTGCVPIVKLAELLPARTVTVAGTDAALFALLSATTESIGAVVLSVTVPVEAPPPSTVVGAREREIGRTGCMVSALLTEMVLAVAVMVAVLAAETADVPIANVPMRLPAGMVILGGTAAAGSELASVTVMLPGAAGACRVTVPVEP